jgi:hypothetical protein
MMPVEGGYYHWVKAFGLRRVHGRLERLRW